MSPRHQAARWLQQTLAALAPQPLLRARLRDAPPLAPYQRIAVLAFGKAAGPMLAGWLEAAPGRGARPDALECWLSTPAVAPGVAPEAVAGVVVHAFQGGHPIPNRDSVRAAQAMLSAARALSAGPAPALLVALVSGGGSALVEAPLAGDLAALRRLNRALVHSGAPIGDINVVRKHRSGFKGGRLAAVAAGSRVDQVSWILSDVAGEDLAAVASGPTCPDASTHADYLQALRRWLPREPGIAAGPELGETPKPGDPIFARSAWHALANNRDACEAVARLARADGLDPVVVDPTADEWELEAAAAYLAARWRALRAHSPRPCLIAGGEVRVRLPAGASGRGGRNQALALRVAAMMAGEAFCFLSVGTDGVDGSSDAAGACVDGATVARARAAGCDPEDHLRRFDAHPLLAATGDLVRTGPTGNNLRDLRIFL